MGDYQSTATVSVSPDALFDYLSEVGNLPKYFARMTSAERTGPETVLTSAEVNGQSVQGEVWFTVDQAANRIEWGSQGPNDYHGWLTVSPQGDGAQVEVHISTANVESGQVQQGVDETVATVKRLVEETAEGPDPS